MLLPLPWWGWVALLIPSALFFLYLRRSQTRRHLGPYSTDLPAAHELVTIDGVVSGSDSLIFAPHDDARQCVAWTVNERSTTHAVDNQFSRAVPFQVKLSSGKEVWIELADTYVPCGVGLERFSLRGADEAVGERFKSQIRLAVAEENSKSPPDAQYPSTRSFDAMAQVYYVATVKRGDSVTIAGYFEISETVHDGEGYRGQPRGSQLRYTVSHAAIASESYATLMSWKSASNWRPLASTLVLSPLFVVMGWLTVSMFIDLLGSGGAP